MLYVLQQQVKEIQGDLEKLSPHKIKHTKKVRRNYHTEIYLFWSHAAFVPSIFSQVFICLQYTGVEKTVGLLLLCGF